MQLARKTFAQLRQRSGIIVQPVVFNPLTARIAEALGYEAIAIGGYALGASLAISEPLISIGDLEQATLAITRVTDLPLMVDAGTGYGEPIHVRQATRRLEDAGAASIHIEDQIYPKRVHYHAGIEHIVPDHVMLQRLEAALSARRDPQFAIAARTDAMLTHGYVEGIRRAKLYSEAGADLIIIFPNDEQEAKQAPRDLPGVELMYVNSTGNRLGRGVFRPSDLETWGWKIVANPTLAINVASEAVWTSLATMREDGTGNQDPDHMRAVRKRIEDIIGLDELYEIERRTVENV